VSPSISYAGRLATDPLNTLGQGESTLVAGTGSQTTYNRWGDYSAMTVDPVDDCTFWYTNEYYTTTGLDWHTRIASFKYPGCKAAPTSPTITNIPASPIVGGSFVPSVSTNGDGTTSVTSSTPSVCAESSGTVSFLTAGTCTLTAHVAEGTTYAAADGTAQSFTVSLPAGPSATGETYATGYNTPLTVAAPGVLTNDSGTGISVTSNTQPANGSVTVNADGSLTFTPKSSIAGPIDFTYTITDSFSRTSTATVRVNVAFPAKPASCVNTWQLNGAATKGNLCEAVLTKTALQSRGTVFFPVAQPSLNIRKVSFDLTMGTGTGGDGTVLFFGDASKGAAATSLGQAGGYLGVGGDAAHAIPGVGVAFDTYNNGGDVSNNFVAFNNGSNLLGAVPGLKYIKQAALPTPLFTNPTAKVVTHVVVNVQGGKVTSVEVNGTTVLTGTLYLPPSVLIGFGSSTGALTDFHSVRNVVTTIN
jgi:hypothetical protein